MLQKINDISHRELLIAGFFLYWGEGTKTENGIVSLSNTDPSALICFIRWLELFGVNKSKLRVRLNLYSDMNECEELEFWSNILTIPKSKFRKSYIKESKRSDITYIQKFIHGTCNVLVADKRLSEQILTGLEVVRDKFADILTT